MTAPVDVALSQLRGVALVKRVLDEWQREAESRCIHRGACGDPECTVTGEDEGRDE